MLIDDAIVANFALSAGLMDNAASDRRLKNAV